VSEERPSASITGVIVEELVAEELVAFLFARKTAPTTAAPAMTIHVQGDPFFGAGAGATYAARSFFNLAAA
jgi:hypothetical protein